MLSSMLEFRYNVHREDHTFLMAINKITFTRVPHNPVTF
jgi:hypothetical protein